MKSELLFYHQERIYVNSCVHIFLKRNIMFSFVLFTSALLHQPSQGSRDASLFTTIMRASKLLFCCPVKFGHCVVKSVWCCSCLERGGEKMRLWLLLQIIDQKNGSSCLGATGKRHTSEFSCSLKQD